MRQTPPFFSYRTPPTHRTRNTKSHRPTLKLFHTRLPLSIDFILNFILTCYCLFRVTAKLNIEIVSENGCMVRIKGEATQLYLVMGMNGTLSAQVCVASLIFWYNEHLLLSCLFVLLIACLARNFFVYFVHELFLTYAVCLQNSWFENYPPHPSNFLPLTRSKHGTANMLW